MDGELLKPGKYYLQVRPARQYLDKDITKFSVVLNKAEYPDFTTGEQIVNIEPYKEAYLEFTTGAAGSYHIQIEANDENTKSEDCSVSLYDPDKKIVSDYSWNGWADLKANTRYLLYLYNYNDENQNASLKVSAKRMGKAESAAITMDKTEFVAGIEGGYLTDNIKVEISYDDGSKKTLTSADIWRNRIQDWDNNTYYRALYSMNGEEQKNYFNPGTVVETPGVMTIYVVDEANNNILGSCEVNIKPYDQQEIPELKEGDNNVAAYCLYKFVAPKNGTISITSPDDSTVTFKKYKLEKGEFVELDQESGLTEGETYYLRIDSNYFGYGYTPGKVNLSFQEEKRLTGIKITEFDRPVYNLGTGAMDDSLDMLKSAIHYTMIYSDGSEVKVDAADDQAPDGVEVNLKRNGDKGLIAIVSQGSVSDTFEIPFAETTSVPQLTLKDNKAHIDLTEAGQYVYKFKAPVTGYYNLSVVMQEPADCFYNFYKSTEITKQPNVDMSQRLVKAGETYYVCVYAESKALDINVVGTPAIQTVTLATTSYTYDGKAKKPAVTVKDSTGKTIVSSKYTVTYSNNTSIGTATVKVKLKDYPNTVSKTFAINPAAVAVTKLENTSTGVKVTWNKSSSATGYTLYRSVNGGTYAKAAVISKGSTVSYTDTKAKTNGAKYSYKVVVNRTVGKNRYSSAAGTVKTGYYMSVPSKLTLTNSAAKTIKVSYGKNTKASGYEIRYSLKSNMSGAMTVKLSGNTKISTTIKNLKKNTRYYVSVRSYKKVGSATYYSAWSTAKNIVIKK